jgi:fructokinase
MADVVCMGELLIDFVATESGVSVGEAAGFVKAAGGAPANVAVAVARLGLTSAFIGQVGRDPFGEHLAEVLLQNGVDTSGLKFTDKANTALAFVALGAGGERSFSFYRNPSADMLMTPDDVDFGVIDAGRAFHFGSVSMIAEPSRAATLAAAKHAAEAGKWVSYDPNLRLALWPSEEAAREGMMAGFEYATSVKISEDELDFLVNGDVYQLWKPYTRLVVVTHGGRGATAYTLGGFLHVEGQGVEAVDTTGAGDAFTGGLLVQLLTAPDLDGMLEDASRMGDVLHFANTVGALTTTRKGAIPALPSREQVEAIAYRAG